jgi:16S rRNA (guanine966-N2)-methyltransferase
MDDPAMRVIAGTARGRRLKTPKGTSVRPTSDKVRGAIFSILLSQRDLTGAAVLDLFAGTGALGIEALSRGAASGVFVEKDTRTAALIEENLQVTGFTAVARVVRADAERLNLASLGRFDLVFADPPYALVLESRALGAIASLLADAGVAVVEHGIEAPPPTPVGLEAFDRREYGDTGVTFYRRAP